MADSIPEPAALELRQVARFLPDVPLDGDSKTEAAFGHGGIAETLQTIVKRCDTPFTVALYGGWGTGKSTIVGRLCELLKADRIPTVVIDVWKYQDDSLRRTVLKELYQQGTQSFSNFYDENVVLNERVEHETSLATEFKLGFVLAELKETPETWRRTKRLFWELGVLAVLVAGASWFYPLQVGAFVASVVGALAVAAGALETMAVLLTPKTRTLTKGRYDDPYEFEKEFRRILNSGFVRAERVLVVLDNLDRVDKDKAVEVLTTVKTFLETLDGHGRSKAVFLIPCDDAAIRKQVSKRFENREDGDEFLRKFFNVSIRIPEFFGTELQVYTLGLLKATRIPVLHNERIAWMTAKAFRSNPRQVKQFVNVLVAEFLLAQQREADDELLGGFTSDHIQEFSLFQLLRTRFPRAMTILGELDQHSLVFEALSAKNQELANGPDEKRLLSLELDPLLKFVREVAPFAEIEDSRSWLSLRKTVHEAALPGVGDFLLHLSYAELDEAIPFLRDLPSGREVDRNLGLAIQEHASRLGTGTAHAEFLNNLLRVFYEGERGLDAHTLDVLTNAYGSGVAWDLSLARLVDPLTLAEMALQPREGARRAVVDAWVKELGAAGATSDSPRLDKGFLVSLVRVLSSCPEWFAAAHDTVRPALAKLAGKDEELMRTLAEGRGAATWIDPQLAFAFADGLAAPDDIWGMVPDAAQYAIPKVLGERVKLLGSFPRVAIEGTVASRTLRAAVQVGDATAANREAQTEDWLELARAMRSAVAIAAPLVGADAVEPEVLNETTRVLKRVMGSGGDAEDEAVLALIDLRNAGGHPDQGAVFAHVAGYLSSAPIENVRRVVEYLGGPAVAEWTGCEEALLQRCASDTALFDLILCDTPKTTLPALLRKMLPRIPEHVMRSLNSLDLEPAELESLCVEATRLITTKSVHERPPLLTALTPSLAPEMEAALDAYATGLTSLLISGDEAVAVPGLRLLTESRELLDGTIRAQQLASMVYDWLMANNDRYRPSAIGALELHFDRLTEEQQSAFVALLFDWNIQQDRRIEAVEHAMGVLGRLEVRYADRPRNFDAIRIRYEGADAEMRAAILRGLAAMRPPRKPGRGEAKDFWDWVDHQQA